LLPFAGLGVFWIYPFTTALPIYLLILGISLFLYVKVFQAMTLRVATGQEGMLGKKGVVIEDIDPEGKIQYASEIWDATARGKRLLKGEKVVISGIRGLRLLVE